MSAVGKDDKLDMALKGAYAANKYSVTASLAQSGKVRPCSSSSVQRAACAEPAAAWRTGREAAGAALLAAAGCSRAAQLCRFGRPTAARCLLMLLLQTPHQPLFDTAEWFHTLVLQLAVAVGYKELVPGLTLGLTGNVPDTDSGARGVPGQLFINSTVKTPI